MRVVDATISLNKVIKVTSKTSKVLGVGSMAFTLTDAYVNGKLENHHKADLATVFAKLTSFSLGQMPGTYGQRKLIFLPIVVGVFLVVYLLYYKKKAPSIIKSYSNQNFLQTKHIVKACCIFVLPLVLIIILLN